MFEILKTEEDVSKLKRQIMREPFYREAILRLRKKLNNKVDMGAIAGMPTNPEMLMLYEELISEGKEEDIKHVRQILKRLKVRSNSGVAVISLLTKPYTCPGRCIYCPTEKNMPKSYLSKEPAAARALANRFDPYKQITSRLKALVMNGHPIDKVEMIFIGGTFNFYKKDYQEWFTKESFRACNNWGLDKSNEEYIHADHGYNLEDLQKINEERLARIIGLSIETRPDYITATELKWLRYLGVTKVELGVQHLNDEVLEFNKREMTNEAMAKGSELLRDYGFKVVYHMMPNLPGSNPEMDVKMFKDLYNGLDHHPDMMKIYPCMTVRGALLYKLYTQKLIDYEPYDDELLTRVLADAEQEVKCYTRLIRVIRDIPADYIIAGSKKSNLREMVDKYLQNKGIKQVDIRAREIRDLEIDPNDFTLTETIYNTRHGKEIFLQFENKEKNLLAGFLRLRLPDFEKIKADADYDASHIAPETAHNWGLDKWMAESEAFINTNSEIVKIDELLSGAALVRELHVYGTMKRVGEEGNQSQHTGMGKALLARAEQIAKQSGYQRLAIISGVGVRNYYRGRGYEYRDTYMSKEL